MFPSIFKVCIPDRVTTTVLRYYLFSGCYRLPLRVIPPQEVVYLPSQPDADAKAKAKALGRLDRRRAFDLRPPGRRTAGQVGKEQVGIVGKARV